MLSPLPNQKTFRLGDPLSHGSDAKLQHPRRGGVWVAMELEDGGEGKYALVRDIFKTNIEFFSALGKRSSFQASL